jgi:hypothetical protein
MEKIGVTGDERLVIVISPSALVHSGLGIAWEFELSSIEDFSLTEDRWAEMRRTMRVQTSLQGRLGYGGSEPGVTYCQILDMSETGVRVEVYVPLDPMPESFSIEFDDVYCRARRCWARGNEIGLEFIFDAAK